MDAVNSPTNGTPSPADADDGAHDGAGAATATGVQPERGRLAPGLLSALALAGVATLLGRWQPVIGGPVFGIVLGAVLGHFVLRPRPHLARRMLPGLGFASKPLLQAAIVVLGTGLSLAQVAHVGGSSLPVMLGTLAVALAGSTLIGRALGVPPDARTLIGVGTGICGASAIAATTAVIKPKQSDVAYAIGTIFTFNLAAVFVFPAVGHALGLDGQAFGLWAGTAVNDTSSVVATAFSYGHGSESYAIVVKLTRSLMIVPIVLALALLRQRRERRLDPDAATAPPSWWRIVPGFIIGFVLAAGANSLGLIPHGWHGDLGQLGAFLITCALAAIGLSMDLREMRRAGVRPLLLGGVLWLLVALTSLGLQRLTGTL